MTGVITKQFPTRGYFFIKPSLEGEVEVFAHARQLVALAFEELRVGLRVSFEIDRDARNRPIATNVQRVNGESATDQPPRSSTAPAVFVKTSRHYSRDDDDDW
jgi:cold shock CspA family protein